MRFSPVRPRHLLWPPWRPHFPTEQPLIHIPVNTNIYTTITFTERWTCAIKKNEEKECVLRCLKLTKAENVSELIRQCRRCFYMFGIRFWHKLHSILLNCVWLLCHTGQERTWRSKGVLLASDSNESFNWLFLMNH